jgi:tetratricopeptide (TPR) repeat protein
MNAHVQRTGPPPGRNEACPCGSGRKFKHCCARKDGAGASEVDLAQAELRRGIALERNGRIDEAILAYGLAATKWPEANSRLGHIMEGLGRRSDAIVHFRAAAGSAPDGPERRMDLVMALLVEENDVEAEAQLRQVLAADPANGDAYALLGRILAQRGRFADAADCYERALSEQPGKAGVYYHLVRTRTLTEADRPLIRRMLAAAPKVAVAEHRVKLHLAIAKAFDDLHDFASAMRQIGKANQARRSLASFDREGTARHVDDLIGRFTPSFVAAHAEHGHPSELPVMIVGLPRSGTTLVEQILSCHPAVEGAGELQFWPERDPLLGGPAGEGWISDYQSETARSCLDMLRAIAPTAARVIDKHPFNFFWLGLIHVVFPRATIIHCRRHPIDTCLSIASSYFAPRANFPAEPEDLVFFHHQYTRLMSHWRATLPAARLVDVDYESLIADPESVSRGLIAALDLAWDPACLRPERNPRAVKTTSTWQVRQPIYRTALERWRRYEPWLGPLSKLAPD